MRYSRLTALATAGVLALGLSGCGTPAESDNEAAGSSNSGALTQASFVEELAAAQVEASTVRMTVSYSGSGAEAAGMDDQPLEADLNLSDPENPAMKMTMDVEGRAIDLISVDGTFYMSMGETTAGKYINLDDAQNSDGPMAGLFQGIGGGMKSSLEGLDPAAQLEGMADAITSFEKTGTETVDGVETDVYKIVVDPEKMEGSLAGDIPTSGMSEMEIVYNVDKDNLPRKMAVTVAAGGQEMVIDSTFTRWGEPVEIEAPTGDQLTTMEEVMSGAAG